MKLLVCIASLTVLATACSGKSRMVERPKDVQVDRAVTQMWTDEVRAVAQDGDWILTRSYSALADVIVVATFGEELSHASIYDAKTDTVIESIDTGVREVTLEQLLQRNHYVMVVRPSNMTAQDKTRAVGRARSKIGAAYDIRGLVGIDNPEKYYCSELVYWAAETEARSGERETVVTPADLMKYGEVIYWSGKRDDARVLAQSTERARERTRTQTRTAHR